MSNPLIQQINHTGEMANCYLVIDDEIQLVIDPGVPPKPEHLCPDKKTFVLATHLHFDHIFYTNSWLQQCDAKFWISEQDGCVMADATYNASDIFGCPQQFDFTVIETPSYPLLNFADGLTMEIIATPGHTRGSVCLLLTKRGKNIALFSGDTFFDDSVGRTDLKGGSTRQLYRSLCEIKGRLEMLNPELVIYAGHGEPFTVEEALTKNPWLSRLEALKPTEHEGNNATSDFKN